MTSPRPPVWTAFATFALATVLFFAASIVGVLAVAIIDSFIDALRGKLRPEDINAEKIATITSSPPALVVSMALGQLSFGAVAIGAVWVQRTPIRLRLRIAAVPREPWVILLGSLALIGWGNLATSLMEYALPAGWSEGSSLALLRRASVESTSAWFVALVVVGAVLAGACEELLFRGYVQRPLCARWGRWPGILITSALFGAVHMDLWHSPLAFGLGVALGWIVEISGSIRPAIVIHGLNNFVAFAALRGGWLDAPGGDPSHLTVAGASLIVAVGASSVLARVLSTRVIATTPSPV